MDAVSGVTGREPSIELAVSRYRLVGRRFVRSRSAMFGLAVVTILFGLAYLSPLIGRWQYTELDFNAFLEPPGGEHWFGTTQNGFDVFALTRRGMQKSLIIGLLGALIATSLAAVVGSFAGYVGGRLNTLVLVLADLLLVLPAFLIIVLGGVGSFWGAVIAGLLVGMVVGLTGAFAGDWAIVSMYLLFIAVVTFRARGIAGKKSVLDV
jgi:ABC-type antimicrobial peptide transport system permease subunit